MKSLTFHGPGDVRIEEITDPGVEGPDDAIVKVEAAGLCGSDLHPYAGRERGLDSGTVMGHEFVGEIVATGKRVRRWALGQRVVAPFSTSCGRCFSCRSGLTSRCAVGELFGWRQKGQGLHGAQAELVRVPLADSTLEAVPASLQAERALFAADILPTALFAAEQGEVGPGMAVLVVGCGPVGLLTIAAAQQRRARRILAVDSVVERLELAARLGAQTLERGNADLVAIIEEATGGRYADVVIEAVGSSEATRLSVDCVRPGGTVVAVGFHTEAAYPFQPSEAYDKNLTFRAGRCPARRFMWRSLELMQREGERLAAMISHRLPLDQGPEGYRLFSRRLDRCVKVVFRP